MASDEENYYCEEDKLPKSNIGGLILRINKMLKKPVINFDLDETLDTFLNQLNDSQQYLSNGIFNVKFAEAGLFLQSSAALYSKKVDLLWDTAVEYQMQLCTYNKSTENNGEETTKIAQRIRNKRKKTIVQDTDPNCHLNENLMGVLDRSYQILEWRDSSPYYEELKNRWKAYNQNRHVDETSDYPLPNGQMASNQNGSHQHPNIESLNEQTQNENSRSPLCDIQFPIRKDIIDVVTGEKLSKYGDIYLNSAVPCLEAGEYSECSSGFSDNTISCYNNDWLLQRYLKQRRLTYKMLWTQDLGDNFEEFRKNYRQEPYIGDSDVALHDHERSTTLCPNLSVVNVPRLPDELMTEYLKRNDLHVRSLIQNLLLKEKQTEGIASSDSVAHTIKKGSERISDADSMFHDEAFHDADDVENTDTLYSSQQSTADSGICCGDSVTVGDSGICCSDNLSTLVQCNESTSIQESIADSCAAASAKELDLNSENNTEIGVSQNDTDGSTSANENQHHVEQIQTETELCDESNLEPNLDVIGRNECVASAEEVAVENNSNCATPELPPFLPIHNKSIIQPTNNTKVEKENRKRKLLKERNSEDKVEKRRRTVFRWLKTTSTTLKTFERFFLQHYEPEFGEADEDRILPTFDDSDDDIESVLSDLIAPDLDEINEEIADSNVSAVDATIAETSESRLMDITNQIPEDSSIIEESNINCTLNNTEGDQEVPDCVSTRTSEPLCDLSGINTTEFNDPSTSASDTCAVDVSRRNHCENATIERLRAVTEWRRFIEPKLQNAELSSKFDIHEYGSRVMDAIPADKNLNFKELVQGKQAPEVVRLFLASLQLANTCNVELLTPIQGELANDKLELKLLTRERYHEHLDEYEAPSENCFREKLARVQALRPSLPVHSTPARRPVTTKHKAKRQKLSYF